MKNADFRRIFKLTPASKAKGPPRKVIPQSHFKRIAAEIAGRKAKKSRRERDSAWWP